MKKLLYIYLAFVLLFSCDNKKNNLYYLNIKGEVKSVHITSFVAIEKFGEIETGDKGWENEWENETKVYFNDKGNFVEQKVYDGDGELIDLYRNKYDDKGNPVEQKGYDGDGKLTFKEKLKYDDKEDLIEYKWYYGDGELRSRLKYKYDDKKNMIEKKDYNRNNGETYNYYYEYEFDDKENWTQQIIFKNDKAAYIIKRKFKYFD